MRIWKQGVLFYLGGSIYMILEFLFRGWSHGSMFLAGGICFLLIGKLTRVSPQLPLIGKLFFGVLIVTMVELAAGLLVNRNYTVWDYRDQFLNFHGQICLLFSLAWVPVSYAALKIYDYAWRHIKT